jgi:hypothetical protein
VALHDLHRRHEWNLDGVAVVMKYDCTCIKCETSVQGLRNGYLLVIGMEEATKCVACCM